MYNSYFLVGDWFSPFKWDNYKLLTFNDEKQRLTACDWWMAAIHGNSTTLKAATKLRELDVIHSILIAYKLAKLAVERKTSFIILLSVWL